MIRGIARTPLHPQWLIGGNLSTARWVKEHARGRVLDLGCANRWIERHLPAECSYTGMDYPTTGLHLYHARPDVFADAARLPLQDASVDTVVMLEVLEHLEHPSLALQEITRVLRPGGLVLLTMPFLYPIHDAPYDYQRLTRHGLARDVEAAGLRINVISSRLGSIESAGLIACLALGGVALQAGKRFHAGIVLVPMLLLAIPCINVLAWVVGRLLPSWDAATNGYQLVARK